MSSSAASGKLQQVQSSLGAIPAVCVFGADLRGTGWVPGARCARACEQRQPPPGRPSCGRPGAASRRYASPCHHATSLVGCFHRRGLRGSHNHHYMMPLIGPMLIVQSLGTTDPFAVCAPGLTERAAALREQAVLARAASALTAESRHSSDTSAAACAKVRLERSLTRAQSISQGDPPVGWPAMPLLRSWPRVAALGVWASCEVSQLKALRECAQVLVAWTHARPDRGVFPGLAALLLARSGGSGAASQALAKRAAAQLSGSDAGGLPLPTSIHALTHLVVEVAGADDEAQEAAMLCRRGEHGWTRAAELERTLAPGVSLRLTPHHLGLSRGIASCAAAL